MAELDADTVVILSSELISKIVGEYFNKKMFREKVDIVDLRPTDTGYMFSVAFVGKAIQSPVFSPDPVPQLDVKAEYATPVRDSNGKFAKAVK